MRLDVVVTDLDLCFDAAEENGSHLALVNLTEMPIRLIATTERAGIAIVVRIAIFLVEEEFVNSVELGRSEGLGHGILL